MKTSTLMVLAHNALHAGSHEVVVPEVGTFPIVDVPPSDVRMVTINDPQTNLRHVFVTQDLDEDTEAGTLARLGFKITRDLASHASERGVIEGRFTRKMSAMIHKELEIRTIAVA